MPSSARLSCLPIALVAISMAFGAPAVRAQSDENVTSWREIAVDPIMSAVHALETRLASLEASIALFAGSFTTAQLNTRQLCVSDETGAQTCITKTQLDLLLARMTQAVAAEPALVARDRAAAIEAPASVVEAPAAVEATAPILPDASAVPEPETPDTDVKPATPANTPVEAIPGAERVGEDSSSKEDRSPGIEQLTDEAIVIAPEPAEVPTQATGQDGAPRDQEPAITGSVITESSGNLLAPSLDAETSIPNTGSAKE